jgi:hypothetical protein
MKKISKYLVCCSVILFGNLFLIHAEPVKGGGNSLADLPADFPLINITTNFNPAPGYFLFGLLPASDTNTVYSNYVMVLNNDGNPITYKKTGENFSGYPLNFMQAPDGFLIHVELSPKLSEYYISDTTLKTIDSLSYSGYSKVISYYRKLPNGNNLLIKTETQPYDFSLLFDEGEPNAFLSSSTIYELDKNKNIIFKWRTLDYYPVKETISPNKSWFNNHVQTNSIISDNDGNFIISNRLLSEITKINRLTGEIMWKMGGKDNEFNFIGEHTENAPFYFSYQGDFKRQANGNVTLFDNGNLRNEKYSRCVEYKLDETAKTAELVWEYRHDPDIYTSKYGSCQRLPNGNTVIGWGGAGSNGSTAVTEITTDKTIAFEATFPEGLYSTRALKYPLNYKIPDARVQKELIQSNTYKFSEGTKNTCVKAKIIKLDAFFYAFLRAEKYEFAPMNPDFSGNIPPKVFPKRVMLTPIEIDSLFTELRFDTQCLGIYYRPAEHIVYTRPKSGTGTFVPLPTIYDELTGELVVSTSQMGEFIFGIPWHDDDPLKPILNYPPDGTTVCINKTINLECSPRGYFTNCDFEVAQDKDFKVLVMKDSTTLTTNRYYPPVNRDYYWRVRTYRNDKMSEWSDVFKFTVMYPFVDVKYPDGGEILQRDTLRKIIRWDKNIYDSVKIELLLKGEPVMTIADSMLSFTGSYSWVIPQNTKPDSLYQVRITSIKDNSISSISEKNFTITDKPVGVDEFVNKNNLFISITPNPLSGTATIDFTTTNAGLVKIGIYNMLGHKISNISDEILEPGKHQLKWSAENLAAGTYYCKIESNNQSSVAKMVIIK